MAQIIEISAIARTQNSTNSSGGNKNHFTSNVTFKFGIWEFDNVATFRISFGTKTEFFDANIDTQPGQPAGAFSADKLITLPVSYNVPDTSQFVLGIKVINMVVLSGNPPSPNVVITGSVSGQHHNDIKDSLNGWIVNNSITPGGIGYKIVNPTQSFTAVPFSGSWSLNSMFEPQEEVIYGKMLQFQESELDLLTVDWRIKNSSSGRKTFEDTIIGNNPMNVNFEDLSTGTNKTYKWTKRDGVLGNDVIFSHKAEPSHVFDGRNPDKAATPEEIQNEAIGVSSND